MTRNGFTLVELMVALIIFGLLSAAGVMLLSGSARVQEGVKARLSDTAALRRTSAILSADLAQALPRPHRDRAGHALPAFHASNGAFELVRAGWDNEDGAPRPSIQRVEYRVAGGVLERVAWPLVDGASPMPAQRLLGPASALRLRFRGTDGAWRDRWDPVQPQDLPLALEIAVDMKPPLRMIFLVGAGRG